MAETLVLRPKRLGWIAVAVFVAPGFVLSLAFVFPNAFAPVLDSLDFEKKSVGVLGWVLVAMLGSFVVAFVHKLVAPGLVLTSETLQIGWYKIAWTEVDDFRRVGYFHVRIMYAPGHKLSPREKLTVWLGYADLYFGPTYITTAYHLDGVALDLLLRRWRLKYGR